MKIISAQATNFASYESLDLNLADRSLTLVSGPTGSGKSTLCDIVPWVLFGVSAKNGAVDDIRRWNSDEPTTGTIYLSGPTGDIKVTRIRGVKNDLHYSERHDVRDEIRGKDLNDTQRMLNYRLGTDADKYLSSSYYHEFSKTAQFFNATAKNRRAMTEQLVDLSLAVKVTEATKERKSEVKANLGIAENELRSINSAIGRVELNIRSHYTRMQNWEADKDIKIADILAKHDQFEAQETRRIAEASKPVTLDFCPTCHSPIKGKSVQLTRTPAERRPNPYLDSLERVTKETSPHAEVMAVMEIEAELLAAKRLHQDNLVTDLKIQQADLNILYDIVDDFRSLLIRRAVTELEQNTNRLLTTHFDAEIRVQFNLEGLDKLDVTVLKDGNECSFTQLSKGQRQLLKLCFGVSVMRQVANHSGVTTNVVMFDEALDGLDEVMRVKAYGLFQDLSTQYESVFVVDHSPGLKEMFVNKIEVAINNGVSTIEET